jgi:hypothetical protein
VHAIYIVHSFYVALKTNLFFIPTDLCEDQSVPLKIEVFFFAEVKKQYIAYKIDSSHVTILLKETCNKTFHAHNASFNGTNFKIIIYGAALPCVHC